MKGFRGSVLKSFRFSCVDCVHALSLFKEKGMTFKTEEIKLGNNEHGLCAFRSFSLLFG